MEPVAAFALAPRATSPTDPWRALALVASSSLFSIAALVVAGMQGQPPDAAELAERIEVFLSSSTATSAAVSAGLDVAARVQLSLAALLLARDGGWGTRSARVARLLRSSGVAALLGLAIRGALIELGDALRLLGVIVDGVLFAVCVIVLSSAITRLCPTTQLRLWRAVAVGVVVLVAFGWLDDACSELELFRLEAVAARVRLSTYAEFDAVTPDAWCRWAFFVGARLASRYGASALLLTLASRALLTTRDEDRPASTPTPPTRA